jgi:DnaJ homolog subfamily C member 27
MKPNRQRIKVISIGDKGVGKSCIIKRFCEGKFVKSYIETVGVDFGVKPISIEEKAVRVNFFDLSGDDRFREVRNEFYRDTQGVVLVFDPSKRDTFENLSNWIQEASKFGADSNVSYVLLANNKGENRKVAEREGRAWAEKHGMHYFEVSARTGTGVEESFMTLFRQVLKKLFGKGGSRSSSSTTRSKKNARSTHGRGSGISRHRVSRR